MWTRCLVVFLASSAASFGLADTPRALTVDQRIEAQRAIEQVYWEHRIWPKDNPTPKPPLSKLLSDEQLRAKVEDYARKSNALDAWWHRPITAHQLQTELDRMSRDTRDPEALRALYSALGNDAGRIAETLARQTLADRLLRSWFTTDERVHADLRRQAEQALAGVANPAEMRALDAPYVEREYVPQSTRDASDDEPADHRRVELEPDDWDRFLARTARRFGTSVDEIPTQQVSRLHEEPDRFSAIAVLSRTATSVRLATATWPKRSFDAWWDEVGRDLDTQIQSEAATYTITAPNGSGCTDDTWSTSFYGPLARYRHTVVWTGTEMIVWGGVSEYFMLDTGARYNPATHTWAPTSIGANVPEGRDLHSAVWTGTEMIIWGGSAGSDPPTEPIQHNTGGRYDPSTDSWTATSTPEMLVGHQEHSAIWTGSEMIVWGGDRSVFPTDRGYRYEPDTDQWTATSTGTNVPSDRKEHTAVWTGNEMIIWAGSGFVGQSTGNTGGLYDPETDSWSPISTGPNVPASRTLHSAVWTGSEMIVWGGSGGGYLNSGGRYDPVADSWAPTSEMAGAPQAREEHAAVWTGSSMIIWGGRSPGLLDTGGRYDPGTDTWLSTSTAANAPQGRRYSTAVWSGTEMIIWGGYSSWYDDLDTGGRYDPLTDSWAPTTTVPNVPTPRIGMTALWTGTEMIVWGGSASSVELNTGGRYVAATDSWTPTSLDDGVPPVRLLHTAVWTGEEMIVWGGSAGYNNYVDTGGRYNPATDRWTAVSTGTGVPAARSDHTSVWTGEEMIVWGGRGDAALYLDTGGRYDPSTDLWTPTAATAPLGRRNATAIWQGSRMIVWGGEVASHVYTDTGEIYNPATDTWGSTTTTDAPEARQYHTAVWTGTEMIVWGGYSNGGSARENTGGRYVPATDSWLPTSTGLNLPAPRTFHSAIWTGNEMIVWGGHDGTGRVQSGGRYDPVSDTWTSTSTGFGVPLARSDHSAVFADDEMLIFGGYPYRSDLGRYCASCPLLTVSHPDADEDGFGDHTTWTRTCDGTIPSGYLLDGTDCDDTSDASYPGATETCDGEDNDCNQLIDDGIAPPDGSPELWESRLEDTAELNWFLVPDATGYDVVKGSLGQLRSSAGDFSVATTECLENDLEASGTTDASMPGVGDGIWYLVRAVNCGGSASYDTGMPHQEESRDDEIAAAGGACP